MKRSTDDDSRTTPSSKSMQRIASKGGRRTELALNLLVCRTFGRGTFRHQLNVCQFGERVTRSKCTPQPPRPPDHREIPTPIFDPRGQKQRFSGDLVRSKNRFPKTSRKHWGIKGFVSQKARFWANCRSFFDPNNREMPIISKMKQNQTKCLDTKIENIV